VPNTKAVGDETEARILHELVARGHSVAVPFGDNDRYDLLVDTGDELQRVQCKTGWREDGCVRFKTGSKTTSDGEPTVVGYDGDIDAFAVRCRDTGQLYWVPLDVAGEGSTYLRVETPEIDHPAVNPAAAFCFDEQLS
jgi:hypothetical protein